MTEKYYEELKIPLDDPIVLGLNKVISTINYDTKKVKKNLYKESVTKEYALSRVSEDALNKIIARDRNVATEDCNLYTFANISFDFLTKRIGAYTSKKGIKKFGISGRIWYPRNGFMGWHTNSDNKGYRLYCTFAREPKKSFFRFRDPRSGDIETSYDEEGWNFRVFQITHNPLWHCVYSETDRFSIGYSLYT